LGTDRMWHRKWVFKLYVEVLGTDRMWHRKCVFKELSNRIYSN